MNKLITLEVVYTGGGCKMVIGHFITNDGKKFYVNVDNECYQVSSIYFMTEDEEEQKKLDSNCGILLSGNLFDSNCMSSKYLHDILVTLDRYEQSFDTQSNVNDKIRDLSLILKTYDENNKLDTDNWNEDVCTNCELTTIKILRDVLPDLQTLTE